MYNFGFTFAADVVISLNADNHIFGVLTCRTRCITAGCTRAMNCNGADLKFKSDLFNKITNFCASNSMIWAFKSWQYLFAQPVYFVY